MSLTESLNATARRALEADHCFCGNEKPHNTSFCKRCYMTLPVGLRRGLARTFNEGYAEKYDECKDWLRIEGGVKAGPPIKTQVCL